MRLLFKEPIANLRSRRADSKVTRYALSQIEEHRADTADGRYVTYVARNGLADRLRAHAIARHFANRTGRRLIVNWEINESFPTDFASLFHEKETAEWKYSSIRELHYNFKTEHQTANPFLMRDPKESLVVFGPGWQSYGFIKLDEEFGGAFPHRELLSDDIRPLPHLQSRIEQRKALWREEMIGVHIRLGDFIYYNRDIDINEYTKALWEVLKRRPNAGVFLASDGDPDQLKPFLEAFGERLEFKPMEKESVNREPEAAVEDFWLLMACDELVLSASGFSRLASLWSGKPSIMLQRSQN